MPNSLSSSDMMGSIRASAVSAPPPPDTEYVKVRRGRRFPRFLAYFLAGAATVSGVGYMAYQSGVTPDVIVSKVAPTVTQYRVAGDSMLPTYADGQVLLFENDQSSPIRRGDIVVAEMPTAWQYASATQGAVVKRVAATEGDTVAVVAGAVHVNGVQVTDVLPTCKTEAYEHTLAAGELFLLGDNRSNSLDSLSVLCSGKTDDSSAVLVQVSSVKAHGVSPTVKDR